MAYPTYERGCVSFDRLNWQIGGHNPQNRIEMAFHLKIENKKVISIFISKQSQTLLVFHYNNNPRVQYSKSVILMINLNPF